MTVQTDFMKRCKALNLHDGKLSDWLDEIELLRQQLAACERQRDELKADAERYQELLYAVQRKFPNEPRHETALRYIKHAEAPSYSNAAKESK